MTGYRRDILDVRQGVAVSFLVVEAEKSPVMFVMRLKVDDRKITEIETMVVRNQKEGCDNMKKQFIPTLAGITHRVIAVDEELGVVAMRMNFGPGSTFQGGGELDVWHSFKIYGNQIHAAEAYCEVVPAGTKSGWE